MKHIFEIITCILLLSISLATILERSTKDRKMVNIDGVEYVVEDIFKTEQQFGVVLDEETNLFKYQDLPSSYIAKVRETPESQVMEVELDKDTFQMIRNKLRDITGYRDTK